MITLDLYKAYTGLPLRTHVWHGLLVFTGLCILVGGSYVLRRSGGSESIVGPPYMSLVDDQLEVIYAGTSHIGYGIDPRIYSLRGMNVSAGALNYELMEKVIARYLNRAPNLRLLVLEAGIVPLRVDTMARLDGDYQSLYRLGLDLSDLPLPFYRKAMQGLKESWILYPIYFMDRWSPSIWVWGRRRLGSEGEGRVDTRGHTTLDRVISSRNDGRVVVAHHQADHLAMDHSPVNLPALIRMLDMAEQRRLPVLFLRMPHHASYVEHRPAEWEAHVQAMLTEVLTTVRPGSVTYLDWEQGMIYMDAHFADGDHLNREGVIALRDALDPVLLSMVSSAHPEDSPYPIHGAPVDREKAMALP
ncbi:MAG TPA: hypothetical protein PKE55_01050 [Kiritimatiellia bacterium]|nr:hypothetical protein [Kiritimatiellia bacterium]